MSISPGRTVSRSVVSPPRLTDTRLPASSTNGNSSKLSLAACGKQLKSGNKKRVRDERNSKAPKNGSVKRFLRWLPLPLILIAAGAFVVFTFRREDLSRQHQNIETAKAFLVGSVLLLGWLLFMVWRRPRVRWSVIGCVMAATAFSAAAFRIKGVTGDLIPILDWRWKRSGLERIETGGLETTPLNSSIQTINDYPQFLGPGRIATLEGPILRRDWKSQPPKLIWRQPIGAGWSGFAVAGNHAVTQEQRADEELVVCYELDSGKVRWIHSDAAHYLTTIAGEGPRATPTIVSNRVFSIGATGVLNCLDLRDGKGIWNRQIIQENDANLNDWGVSCSPLVFGNQVIVSAGGSDGRSLVAYDAETGEPKWGGGDGGGGYSSPQVGTFSGVEQILIFNDKAVVAHDIETGSVLWEYPWKGGHPHVAIPLVLPNDHLLVSSGYGVGSELLKITNSGTWSVERVWRTTRLKSKFANLLYRDGFIYGLDDGILVCLDAATGALKWKEGRYGHGQMILAGGLLLLTAESGDIVLLEASPEGHRELTRFSLFADKTWNPPALAGEFMVVRNDKEAACLRLPILEIE